MADTEQVEEHLKKKRKGTPLLAVMDESCSSCAGSPVSMARSLRKAEWIWDVKLFKEVLK